MLLAGGGAPRGGAALGQHGDLGAEVVAVAAHGGRLVLGVGGAQEPLQHPPAPLPPHLRLHLRRAAPRVTEEERRREEEGFFYGRATLSRFYMGEFCILCCFVFALF